MIALLGLAIVTAAVMGGYVLAGGKILVLAQPAEFLIIGGAVLGSVLIGNRPRVVRRLVAQVMHCAKPGPGKDEFQDLLVMSFELLSVARREGVLGLENHVEEPAASPVMSKYPSFLRKPHAVSFFTDTIRLLISGADVQPHELEALIDLDMETHHRDSQKPSRILQIVADSLPGLGIVAAVLGVVITMQAIDGPPGEIGQHVGAALVGTFLGVLLSYGFVGPLAQNLAGKVEQEHKYFEALKQILLAFHRGAAARVAVEFARRSLPDEVRPKFTELEDACRAVRGRAHTQHKAAA